VFEGVWTQEEKHVIDDRNYCSLADEFDDAAVAETDTADELMRGDVDDDDVNTVRRRVPTDLGDL